MIISLEKPFENRDLIRFHRLQDQFPVRAEEKEGPGLAKGLFGVLDSLLVGFIAEVQRFVDLPSREMVDLPQKVEQLPVVFCNCDLLFELIDLLLKELHRLLPHETAVDVALKSI